MSATDLLLLPDARGPGPDTGIPLLENIRQPLYSSVALNGGAAIPNELRFFTYSIGGVVPGAGDGAVNSTDIHTNMDIAAALPTPKIFVIDGIRLALNNLEAALTTPPVNPAIPSATTQADLLEDLQRLIWGTMLTVRVGPKDYASCPSFCMPMNAGIGGSSSAGLDDTAASEQILNQALHSAGRYYAMNAFPIFLFSQQTFHVKLRAPQATPPTIAIDRLVTCYLDGVLGREAM